MDTAEELQFREGIKLGLKDLGFLKEGQEGRIDHLPLSICEQLRDEIDQLNLLKRKRERHEKVDKEFKIDPEIAHIQVTTEERTRILLLPDMSSARVFFMRKHFAELTDNVRLPENKMLEPFDFVSDDLPPVIQGLKDRYKELKAIQETAGEEAYFIDIAEEYATQEEMDYIKFFAELVMQKQSFDSGAPVDDVRFFETVAQFLDKRSFLPISKELDKKIEKYADLLTGLPDTRDECRALLGDILKSQDQIKEFVLNRMQEAFIHARKFMDRLFGLIGETGAATSKDQKSPYYKDLERIHDVFELFEFCAHHYTRIKNLKAEIAQLSSDSQERKEKIRMLRDHVKAFWEGQCVHALLNEFRLDSLSTERLFAEEFDSYFQKDYMQHIFPYSPEVRVKKLREDYNIPVNDEGVATIYFNVSKGENGKDSVVWDWHDQDMREAISVYPRILIDKETEREIVCLAYTDVKSPESLVAKKVRKQEIAVRDVNRMTIAFLSTENKATIVENESGYLPFSIRDAVLFVERNMTSLASMEQNLRTGDEDGNPHSDKNFQVLKGVLLCRHRNGQRRMELQIFNSIAGYLISQSVEHPAGHANYERKRTLIGLIPKFFPKSIYGDAFLEQILHRELNEYTGKQIKKYRPDLLEKR